MEMSPESPSVSRSLVYAPSDKWSGEKSTLMKPCRSIETVGPEMLWGTSVFCKPVDWVQGKICTLLMFDNVANGHADARTLNPRQSGDLQLILEFGIAPGTNITVLVYAEFENVLEIDSNGAVLYNIYQP